MINDLENNAYVNNGMSELEFDKNSVEMMRYRPNKFSYSFGFGGLACSIVAALISLNSLNPNNFQVILKIFLNIFILLFGFLLNEKVKAYSSKASIGMICIGAICATRIFWVPLQLIIGQSLKDSGAASAEYNKYLGKTITSHANTIVNWLPANGIVRAVLVIILLGASATFFIISGVVGYKRSIKLNTYLDSIKDIKK